MVNDGVASAGLRIGSARGRDVKLDDGMFVVLRRPSGIDPLGSTRQPSSEIVIVSTLRLVSTAMALSPARDGKVTWASTIGQRPDVVSPAGVQNAFSLCGEPTRVVPPMPKC